MDEQTKMPEIKPETNGAPKKEQRGGLAALLAKLGLGGGAATGGAGVGLGGVAAGGGLLATKAGLVALIVIGTTVAGGIGMVGYNLMSSPSPEPGAEGMQSIFETRPQSADAAKPAAEGEGGAYANKPGRSGSANSLDMFVKANNPEDAAAGGEKPAEQGDQTAAASASPTNPIAPVNNTTTPNAPFSGPKLAGGKKMGELSKSMGGGSTGASYSGSGGAGGNAAALMASARAGQMQGMSGGGGGRAANVGRGMAGVRRNDSFRQLGNVRKDHFKPQSSALAGRTYDGGGLVAGSETGMDSGNGDTSGVGQDNGVSDQAPTLNQPSSSPQFPTPEAAPGFSPKEVTPWKDAIDRARMMLMMSMALMFVAGLLADSKTPWVQTIGQILGYVAAAMAAYVVFLGAQMAFGGHRQMLQGSVFMVAGTLVAVGALSVAITGTSGAEKAAEGAWISTQTTAMIAGVALLAGSFIKPKEETCHSQKSCDKIEGKGVYNWSSPAPSESGLQHYFASVGAERTRTA